MSRRRRAAPKPLQGPMAAKIALRAEAHVMSRGKEEVRGREAEREGSRTLRRGQLQPTAKKRTVLYCLSVCLSVYSPPSQLQSTTTTTRSRLSTPNFTRANPNHDGHHHSRKPHPGAIPQKEDRPTHVSRIAVATYKYTHCRTGHLAAEAAILATEI
jgi:hypothetical protein